MKNKTIYIKAILIVFGLLILSRIPILVTGNVDRVTLLSTVVELAFFIWGIVLIVKK
ncbi:hypothetical protein [Psychroflexus montanilacus]|uniref:hypothetical protein n=1 Tax=Psychroflexus montanilacus TaxID=2873598 RepID=UPI001CCECC81|nr:hypothetical protein [Psychroflexus montanilacus]MBZ9651836.1 hypothetical protein [Psychroflexus montanilacus]